MASERAEERGTRWERRLAAALEGLLEFPEFDPADAERVARQCLAEYREAVARNETTALSDPPGSRDVEDGHADDLRPKSSGEQQP